MINTMGSSEDKSFLKSTLIKSPGANDSTLEQSMQADNVENQLKKENEDTIEINGKVISYQRESAQESELEQLSIIAKQEAGQKQFVKQGICAVLLLCVIIINLLQPSSSKESLIGINMCGAVYWIVELLFVAICGLLTWYAIKISAEQQKLKVKYGINHLEGDVIFEGKALTILVCIGFVGGLVAGALGLGGGSIYNPALLSLGVHPKTSGATGMFLVLFSTVNTCLINFLNGYLDFTYALWISAFSLLGSILGMLATDKIVAATGKPSIMVWILVLVFIISTVATPIFAVS